MRNGTYYCQRTLARKSEPGEIQKRTYFINSSRSPFRRRHFQIHFYEWKALSFDSIFIKLYFYGPIDNNSALGQVMAWSRTGDRHSPTTNFTGGAQIINSWNEFGKYICVITAIFLGDQWLHSIWLGGVYTSVDLSPLFRIMACRLFDGKPLI